MPRIRVIIWNDNPNDQTGHQYALAQVQSSANTLAVQARGLDDLANQLMQIQQQGNVIENLAIATHGAGAAFQISTVSPGTPIQWVGYGNGDIHPLDFIDRINPYILPMATITFLSCELMSSGNGQLMMLQLSYIRSGDAYTQVRYVRACSGSVFLRGRIAETEGSIFLVGPGHPNPFLYMLRAPGLGRLIISISTIIGIYKWP